MATATDSTISRLEKLLASAAGLFAPFASRAVFKSEEAVEEIIEVYAPQPSRTRAKTFNTYVRGKGRYPKSAFVPDKTQPGGYKTKRVKKSQIQFTSEQLDKRWLKEVHQVSDGAEGTLKNTASYSGYVNGFESGDVKQVGFHRASGWVSADEALKRAEPMINAIADQSVNDFVSKFAM